MSTELNPEADQLALANKWLDITVERFVENMLKLRITDTRTLLGSFQKQVVGAASGRLQMRLSYALYGQFVDMGVGRGMGKGVKKADDGYDRIRKTRGQLRRHTRKPRNWYSREMSHQTKRLSELMLDLYGTVLIAKVANTIPGETTINF
ncbi:hypothetical protein GCM10027511_43350 [Hymenobacter humi]